MLYIKILLLVAGFTLALFVGYFDVQKQYDPVKHRNEVILAFVFAGVSLILLSIAAFL